MLKKSASQFERVKSSLGFFGNSKFFGPKRGHGKNLLCLRLYHSRQVGEWVRCINIWLTQQTKDKLELGSEL